MSDHEVLDEIERRRTFAIISHPDAGKTTLTEKLLLFGGAVRLAGTVKGRKAARHATSDWMELEKQRGISVTSSVMQFPYAERIVNLLDTPGHEDFSEDTYRTLTAVDSALMVIDGARGIEARTIRLMEVCRLRDTPIVTRPGSLLGFCELIGDRAITEFNYRFAAKTGAHIFVGVEISDPRTDKRELLDTLERAGYPVLDLSDNEMAKLHVRYMVGGHAPGELDEVVYRFEFPERPGALVHFLTRMGSNPWNISMFHYRNHGSAYGRVLIGLQVPQDQRGAFQSFLDEVGYEYRAETDNPAYGIFLR